MEVRIHRILTGSRANGPGIRNVVWFQGCTLRCPGCFNPQTHAPHGGQSINVEELCDRLLSPFHPCDGITISGGEPFQQAEALLNLLQELQKQKAPLILVFSGYSYNELRNNPVSAACLPFIDALICGPYDRKTPPVYERFCSSGNQELVLLSERYTENDFRNLPVMEYFFDDSGNVIISGINS